MRLFITCWLVYGAHFATNTVREIFPALSLGDHLSFDVSEYKGLHPDIFELPGRGVFINNNPGASILGAVPYIITRPVIDFAVDRVQAMREATGVSAHHNHRLAYGVGPGLGVNGSISGGFFGGWRGDTACGRRGRDVR